LASYKDLYGLLWTLADCVEIAYLGVTTFRHLPSIFCKNVEEKSQWAKRETNWGTIDNPTGDVEITFEKQMSLTLDAVDKP
jgi:hypothetical protein